MRHNPEHDGLLYGHRGAGLGCEGPRRGQAILQTFWRRKFWWNLTFQQVGSAWVWRVCHPKCQVPRGQITLSARSSLPFLTFSWASPVKISTDTAVLLFPFRFLIDEDEDTFKLELKEAFRMYDKVSDQWSVTILTSRQQSQLKIVVWRLVKHNNMTSTKLPQSWFWFIIRGLCRALESKCKVFEKHSELQWIWIYKMVICFIKL